MIKTPILFVVLVLLVPATAAGATILVDDANLQASIDAAKNGDTLVLMAMTYAAIPMIFVDSLCGNCDDPLTEVAATYGFIVKNKILMILGSDRERTRLVTRAGYGLYFDNSRGSIVSNLTVTGGKRDPDGNATDGGVVVRASQVGIIDVDIVDNDDRIDSVAVGIGGIIGREGSSIYATGCRIVNNGWDGVALYRGALATVVGCEIRDGRGVGIGVTWDASCQAYRNTISGYWKGIGAFGSSWVMARNNLVKDNLGWGVIATGKSFMDIANNVVEHNGNCGVAPWSTESRGRIVNNIIINNGWREKWVCPCVGVWNYGDWAKWSFSHNIVWGNQAGNYEDIWDQTGLNGNLNDDPLFLGEGDYQLQDESPARHAGDSLIFNIDGTRSHIGLYGGPQAWR